MDGGHPPFPPGLSRGEALTRARALLDGAGIGSASLDGRVLLRAVLGIGSAALLADPDVPLGRQGAEAFSAAIARRMAGEPVGRILGAREFWGMTFRLSSGTLEPRPDTETVVAAALAAFPQRDAPLSVLDLGTGSGCLLVAILAERPRTRGIGLDRSHDALAAARGNATLNAVDGRAAFAASNWAEAVRGPFDLVVSNPPYIPTGDIPGLDREVRLHDPAVALDGGRDGLAAYRAILADLSRVLAPAGRAVLEMGIGQAPAIAALAGPSGFATVAVAKDLAGLDRAIVLARTP